MESSLKPAVENYEKATMEFFLLIDETKQEDLELEKKV